MPSIEFLGYSVPEHTELTGALRAELADLPFFHEIVYVHFNSTVVDASGEQQRYLRVCTRNAEKAAVLLTRLKYFADVEFIRAEDIVFRTS